MARTRRAALVLMLPLLLAAGACGGSSDEEAANEAGAEGAEGASGTAVRIADFAFTPSPLEVKAGATVTFTNEDGFAHTVTAEDKSYDSKALEKGASFEHTYDEPGTYEFFCAIHNSMTGSIVVA